MAYYVWRSDAPANATRFDRLEDGYRALRAAMAACHDRSIEWCLIHADDTRADRDWETVACGRHGDLRLREADPAYAAYRAAAEAGRHAADPRD